MPPSWSSWPTPSVGSRRGGRPARVATRSRPTWKPTVGTWRASSIWPTSPSPSSSSRRRLQRTGGDLAAVGTTKPVLPGIMPVTSLTSVPKMASNGPPFPSGWSTDWSTPMAGGAKRRVRHEGVVIATELCEQLLDAGVQAALLYVEQVQCHEGDLLGPRPGHRLRPPGRLRGRCWALVRPGRTAPISLMAMAAKPPVHVTVTGAAGQIGYALCSESPRANYSGRSAGGAPAPRDRAGMKALEGVVMEIDDGAFPLVSDIVTTTDLNTAFDGRPGRSCWLDPAQGGYGAR